MDPEEVDEDNVIPFPGVEPRDWSAYKVDCEGVLSKAIEHGVKDVVVVGRLPNGAMFIASSCPSAEEVLGRLHVAANYLADGLAGDEPDEDDGA